MREIYLNESPKRGPIFRRAYEYEGYVIDSWVETEGFFNLYLERIVDSSYQGVWRYYRKDGSEVWTKSLGGNPIKISQDTWGLVLDDPETHFVRLFL